MLVISRKHGEKVFIGGGIVVTVLEIDRGKIRLGIEAPRDILILREELLNEERRAQMGLTSDTRPSPAHREDSRRHEDDRPAR